MYRKLTDKQQDLLLTIYKFRYITTENLAKQRNISHNSAYSALETLNRNDYLGKLHKKSYRLMNKHARYYLKPLGIKYLEQPALEVNKEVFPSRRRDNAKSVQFVDLQVAIHGAYIKFRQEYGQEATIYTATEFYSMEGVMKPYPSLYVKTPEGKQYLVELTDDQHLFLVKKRIRKYIEYFESDDWEWDTFPIVRIARRSKADRTKLLAYIEEKMDDNYLDDSDFVFEVTGVPISVKPKSIID